MSPRLEIAEAAAQAVLSEQSVTPNFALYAKAGLALLAVQVGDQSAAKEHYAYLLGQRSTMMWTLSSVDRLLGLLSQTMGNLDQAAGHFEDALTFCRRAGYRPELAWSCCDYADMLVQRNDSGVRARAILLTEESLAISTELDMIPLIERVAERLELIQVQPSAAPTYSDGLTQREVEVPGAGGRRKEQRRHRRGIGDQPQHRGAPREQHPGQDRFGQPDRSCPICLSARSSRIGTIPMPTGFSRIWSPPSPIFLSFRRRAGMTCVTWAWTESSSAPRPAPAPP